MQPVSSEPITTPKASLLFAFIGFTGLALFLIGLVGQANLMDNERRVGAYVLDAIQHGHWMAQRDAIGEVASKPPLFTWVAALGTLAIGHLNRFALYFPSAMATVALGLILLSVGRARFGWAAGLLAGLAYVLSPMGDQVVQTARYDGFFALPVGLAALAAYRAWSTGRGWTWFWVAAAFATLVKGPLGLLLGGGGLLAVLWEWRSQSPPKRVISRGSQVLRFLLGIVLFGILCGGWFWLAWREMGQPLIEKQIGRELVGHIVKGSSNEGIGLKFWEPSWAFLTLFLPWSIPGILGFWRVIKHPSADPEARRFERFLFCWFFLGLIVFSVAAHQRSRLIFPLMPAAALIAGREMARWVSSWTSRVLLRRTVGVTAVALVLLFVNHQWLMGGRRGVQRTRGMEQMAHQVKRQVGPSFPLTYVGRNASGLYLFPLQFYLNTMRTHVRLDEAVELLRGPAAAFVVLGKAADPKEEGAEPGPDPFDELKSKLGTNAPALHELARSPAQDPVFLRIVSNHPTLEWPAHTIAQSGALRIELKDARHVRTSGGKMIIERRSPAAMVVLSNVSTNTLDKVRVRLTGQGPERVEAFALQPGQRWLSSERGTSHASRSR